MSIRVASTALLIVTVAGCRGEMDGRPSAGGDAERVVELPGADAASVLLHPDSRTIA